VRRFVEVGVAYGYHGVHLLTEVPELEYTGVDPYVASYDEEDIFASDVASLFGCDPQAAMDRLHAAVAESLAEASSGRAKLLRTGSVEASQTFDDESLCAVFVDGNHLTSAVKADISSWFPKLRKGGLLIGDDYQRPSVKAAWDEAFSDSLERNMHLLQNGTSGYRTVVVRKS
jgi:predicted O-methyltransferase YrrM